LLAVRYTVDAEEALKRDQLAVEAAAREFEEAEEEEEGAAPQSGEEHVRLPSPATGPAGYVIQLRGVGFLWRWAVFEGIGGGSNSALPPMAFDLARAVAAGVLPRLSERSARRAAERAARGAFRQAIASE
jgi:hypothetical protein